MNLYEYSAVILLPIILFHFIIDFLSDSEIPPGLETKIGILQFIHTIWGSIMLSGIFILPFTKVSLSTLFITIATSIVIQSGFLINNDYCWMTKMTNNFISPTRKNRKWRGNIMLLTQHYIRGDQWAYSDIRSIDQTYFVLISNITLILKMLLLK
jgi:hypothetical protein